MHTFLRGTIGGQYLAHFVDVLQQLEPVEPDWLEVVEVGGSENPLPWDDPERQELQFRIFREKSAQDLLRDAGACATG
jgi:hypothetical protein